MSLIAALLLTGSAPAAAPVAAAQVTAVAVARARILAPAEVRRVDGKLEIRTGDRKMPMLVHRTERKDGGETADFY